MTFKEKTEKLKILNSMPVAVFSVSCGEVEYVSTKETDEKIKELKEMGMTEDDYKQMTDEDGHLDISYFAFYVIGAEWWSRKDGFYLY